ncbi:MAG: SAM-dependent methyltransferase [Anaerolineales bacterium]
MLEKPSTNITLGSTARWTAAARAIETAREDHLFDDPWAAALAGADGTVWAANRSPDSLAPMVLRIRFFDDFLQRITKKNAVRQVVLMAAGLDTRAFRLDWPDGTQIFELDQPGVLQEKEQILHSAGAKPACTRHAIQVDLTGPWKELLFKAGLEPEKPAIWLLEGFLFYIPNESITRLLNEINSLSAPGSWLGFDIINSITLTSPYTRQWVEMQAQSGAPWIGTLDDPAGSLAALGWHVELSQAGAPDANHGRWRLPIIPVNMPEMPHNWFVTAQK